MECITNWSRPRSAGRTTNQTQPLVGRYVENSVVFYHLRVGGGEGREVSPCFSFLFLLGLKLLHDLPVPSFLGVRTYY